MKADWNDAPEYIRTNTRNSSAKEWMIPGIIGTCITLGLLHVAGSAFLNRTVQTLAEKNAYSAPVPVSEIARVEEQGTKNWERVVDEQARRDELVWTNATPNQTEITSATVKQTAFNDNNYTPRGADNVVSFIEPSRTVEMPKPADKMKVTIIEQEPSMKDRACWPHKEGSIERRNCRSSVGLNYRD